MRFINDKFRCYSKDEKFNSWNFPIFCTWMHFFLLRSFLSFCPILLAFCVERRIIDFMPFIFSADSFSKNWFFVIFQHKKDAKHIPASFCVELLFNLVWNFLLWWVQLDEIGTILHKLLDMSLQSIKRNKELNKPFVKSSFSKRRL